MASWTYDTDGVALLVQEAGQGVAVGVGRLHAGVNCLFSEPFLQSLEAAGRVGEGFVPWFPCGGLQQGGVEVELADVYAQCDHRVALSRLVGRSPVSHPCGYKLSLEQRASDTVRPLRASILVPGADLNHGLKSPSLACASPAPIYYTSRAVRPHL